MCRMNTRAALTAPLALAGLLTLHLALVGYGYQFSLGYNRSAVDSYNTERAAYESDLGRCVAAAMQAHAE